MALPGQVSDGIVIDEQVEYMLDVGKTPHVAYHDLYLISVENPNLPFPIGGTDLLIADFFRDAHHEGCLHLDYFIISVLRYEFVARFLLLGGALLMRDLSYVLQLVKVILLPLNFCLFPLLDGIVVILGLPSE